MKRYRFGGEIILKDNTIEKEFINTFKQLTQRHNPSTVWHDFVTMVACSFSNSIDKTHFDDREKLYLSIIKKYNKEEQELFPQLLAHTVNALDENPEQDFLGDIFMRLNLGDKNKGQVFTPYNVAELMAKVNMGDNVVSQVKEQGWISITDHCCGGGATLIAGLNEARHQLAKQNLNYQNHIFIAAQDIDPTVAMMCYIQISLLGVAGFVKVGDTFTEPMASDDTTENYWFTPMYFSDLWMVRRMCKGDGK